MPMRRSLSVGDTSKRRSLIRREHGRMSAQEMSSSLVKAIAQGDEEWTASLLAAGASANARDNDGKPVLCLLFENSGSPESCKMLLEKGANPDEVAPSTKQSPLHLAAKKGFQVCIGQLLSAGANPDVPDGFGNTPLMYACAYGHQPSARMLLKSGAISNRVNIKGESGLHLAARQGSLSCVRELLSVNANLNAVDIRGFTPLLIATKNNQVEIAEVLLQQQGCSLNDQDPITGRTALHCAVHNRDLQTVSRLIQLGANLDLRDSDWNPAFMTATNLQDREIIQVLVRAGCDVGVTDKSFNTALHLSAREGYAELIPILVMSGLDLNLKGAGGLTALMLGAVGGHQEVVRTLLDLGANPNVLDRNRAGAIIYAMMSNASDDRINDLVKCLIQYNSDLDEAANLNGLSRGRSLPSAVGAAIQEDRLYSPIEIAYLRDSESLCRMLVRAGCDMTQFSFRASSKRNVRRISSKNDSPLLLKLLQSVKHQQSTVRSLKDLCRRPTLRWISRLISLSRISELDLPENLLQFLQYGDLDEITKSKTGTQSVRHDRESSVPRPKTPLDRSDRTSVTGTPRTYSAQDKTPRLSNGTTSINKGPSTLRTPRERSRPRVDSSRGRDSGNLNDARMKFSTTANISQEERRSPPKSKRDLSASTDKINQPKRDLSTPRVRASRSRPDLSTPIERTSQPRRDLSTPRDRLSQPKRDLSTPRDRTSQPRDLSTPRDRANQPRRDLSTPRDRINQPRRESSIPRVSQTSQPRGESSTPRDRVNQSRTDLSLSKQRTSRSSTTLNTQKPETPNYKTSQPRTVVSTSNGMTNHLSTPRQRISSSGSNLGTSTKGTTSQSRKDLTSGNSSVGRSISDQNSTTRRNVTNSTRRTTVVTNL